MSVFSNKTTLPGLRPCRHLAKPPPHLAVGRLASLILALLVAVAALATVEVVGVVRNAPLADQLMAWSACAMLVFMAILMLLLGKYVTTRLLNQVEQQLRTLHRDDRLDPLEGPVPAELSAVMSALEDYVGHVRARLDDLRLQRAELDLQMRVAETERRNTEAIIFSISDAVLVVDAFGELLLANTAAEKLFGFHLNQWRHRPIDRFIQDSSLVALIKEARAQSDSRARRQIEYGALRDGRRQTFNITLSTVLDAKGHDRGVVAVFHDVTREREIAQLKTDFVSRVSHELRTPLSSIKAYIEMLVDGEAHDEQTRREFYDIIDTETDRLQRLIANILNISRIESGVVEIQREPTQVNLVIHDVLEMLAPQAAAKEIRLDFEPAESLPLIRADGDLLHQAVMNLVGNSIKYTASGGWVRVRATVDDGQTHMVIGVADNGMGIESEDLTRIFDKFYRSKESEKTAKGTGLGLNLVKHIVETAHRGEIAVASEHGAGTTITLRLPLSEH